VTDLVVPFNRVATFGRELDYLHGALDGGAIAGNGRFTRACEDLLDRIVGTRRALLTTSGTHALELCALLLDLEQDDEVILPSFTFVSSANAFLLRGARPVFVDVRDDTLNLDERLVERAITRRTRAIVAVHYAGVGCRLDVLQSLASTRSIALVEDTAHGLFGSYRGRPLGSFGRVGALSFHETKNVSCGEGGALLVNDADLIARAEVMREKGTDRSRFLRGEVDKYTWHDLGSSYVPSEILAGFLLGQLEARVLIQERRRRVFERYEAGLAEWAGRHDVRMPFVPEDCDQAFHMFYLRLADRASRDEFIGALRKRGILAVSHYVPLHLSPVGRRLGYAPGDMPVTERAAEQIVRLPFFASLTDGDQDFVMDVIRQHMPAAAKEASRV
jgi:dTDP-4-amino-4,6-dideoxygalactose transaminase